ncbi:MAG: hypothetical protein RL701_1581 [Pseudomonadota bacterium]|jgi:uncharacterized protein (DUF952 family)
MTTVYKVLSNTAWLAAQELGEFRGSELDLRDGYMHFSTADQLAETLARHYAGVADLVLLFVRIDAIQPSSAWRWEPSRGGALFPHLYAPLPLSAVHQTEKLTLQAGGHQLPNLPR